MLGYRIWQPLRDRFLERERQALNEPRLGFARRLKSCKLNRLRRDLSHFFEIGRSNRIGLDSHEPHTPTLERGEQSFPLEIPTHLIEPIQIDFADAMTTKQ